MSRVRVFIENACLEGRTPQTAVDALLALFWALEQGPWRAGVGVRRGLRRPLKKSYLANF